MCFVFTIFQQSIHCFLCTFKSVSQSQVVKLKTQLAHLFTILPALVLHEWVLIWPQLLHFSSLSKTGLNIMPLAFWFLHKITNPGKHPRAWHRSLALGCMTTVTVWTVPCSGCARIAVLRLWWLNGYAILDSISSVVPAMWFESVHNVFPN